jgi:hypothetical protein
MFELEDGTIVDTTGYSENKLKLFNIKNPDAKAVNANFAKDPADAETVVGSEKDTVSLLDDYLSGSKSNKPQPIVNEIVQDNVRVKQPKFIDPKKIIEDRELEAEYRSKKLKSLKAASEYVKNNINDGFDVTDGGTFDFDNQEKIIEFRDQANGKYIKNNPVIQDEIIPRIKKEKEEDLNLYIAKAKDQYNLNNPEDVTQENIDAYLADVNDYYAGIVNSGIQEDSAFKEQMRLYNESMDSELQPYYQKFAGEKLNPNLFAVTEFAKLSRIPLIGTIMEDVITPAVKGLQGVGADMEDAGLKAYEGYLVDKIKKVDNANFGKGFEDTREGYWVPAESAKGSASDPNKWKFIPEVSDDGKKQAATLILGGKDVVKGTWGEFTTGFNTWLEGEDEQLRKRAIEVQNKQLLLQGSSTGDELDKFLAGENMGRNAIRLAAEQLPQMALSIFSLGASSSLQIGGGIYSDGIDNEARKRFNIPEGKEITMAQRREILKDEDFMDSLESKAVTGGFIGGQLDRLGASKALKVFTVKGAKSILRGGYKNFLKNTGNLTATNTRNAATESITEVLQETLQMGLSGGGIKEDQLFDAGATAFISTMTLGIGGNVKTQTNAEYKTIVNKIAGKLNPKSAEAFYNQKIVEIDNEIKNTVDKKALADLEAKKKLTIEVRDANTKIPSNFSSEAKEQSLDLLIEKQNIQNQISGKDSNLVTDERTKISEINDQLSTIAATEKVTQNVLKAGKPLADVKIEVARSDQDAKDLAGKNSIALDNDATGFISEDGTKIFINQKKAAELGEVNTASHELLHAVLFKTLYNRDSDGKVTGNNVVRGLAQALDAELAGLEQVNDIYAERLALYKKDPSSVQAEEKLALFADALFYGDIKTNDGVITKIKDFVRRLLQNAGFKNIEFNNSKDVINFLKDYNRAVKRGKLGKAITKVAEEGAVVGEGIKRFTGPEAVARDKANRSVRGLENVKNKIAGLESNFKSARSQNDIAVELPTMISTQIKNRFQLSNDKLDAFTDDVIGKLYLAQEPTKWDGRGTLYGFLNGRISNRIKDVVREEYNKVPQERLYLGDIQNIQVDEQVNLAAQETKTETKQKPKFKTLSESSVLPADQKQNIKSKLLSTIRVLKSKLNDNKSLNRTVSPLIADIKKQMGKQADIEFKKRLGPKKDGILRRNYLKFKKPILENMTTTWLMTAMPFAVQKQVDGKFTSDWQGKKIDRETVDTDKAGRTSGADIVRRLPNIANRVTDEQFLSYMFKDGDVIRGRKESLSKAMGEEYAFDVLSEELNKPDSEIRNAFENNQQALGVVLSENFVQEVEKDIERGNVKFSRAGTQGLNRNKLRQWRAGQDQFLNSIEAFNGDYGKNIERTVLQTIKDVWPGNTFTKAELKGLSKQFASVLKAINQNKIEFSMQAGKTFREYLLDVANDIDGNLSIAAYTGATKPVSQLFTFKDRKLIETAEVKEARSIVEDVVSKSKLSVQDAYSFLMNTFNSTPRRPDLYQGKQQVINALKNSGYTDAEIKTIGRSTFTQGAVTKTMLGDNFDTKASIEQSNKAWDFTTDIVKSLRQVDPNVQAMVLAAMNSGTKTSLRDAAPVLWRSKTKPSQNPKDYRYEHAIPARVVLAHMYQHYINGDKSISMAGLKSDYKVAIIPLEMDDILGDVSLGQVAIAGYNPGVTPWYNRYYNILTRNKVQYAIEEIANPKNIIGQQFEDTYNKNNPTVKSDAITEVKKDIAYEKAFKKSRSLNYAINPKGITVLDFDDTVAISSSKVIVKMPVKDKDILDIAARRKFGNTVFKDKQDFQKTFNNLSEEQKQEVLKEVPGPTKKITPAEFATESAKLEAEGAVFDFKEFNKVVKGRKGPLFDLALKRQAKFGNNNIYILTARPQESALAIQKFAKGLGLNLKLKNITGLADGKPSAKADWIVGKVNEGFNDFYFADDAYKNVKAVQEALNLFDVKSDVQQAKIKFNKSLNADINQMIARNTGVRAETTYSAALARRRGARKGRFKFFVPYGAEDFRGLTSYVLAGKGKQGDADQKFFEDNLVTPYIQGVAAMEKARRALKNDYLGLRKMFPDVKKKLNKKIPGLDYTFDQAIRIYLYNKSGFEVEGISKTDLKKINSLINKDENLKSFADGLQLITKKDKWVEPDAYWDTTSILGDLNTMSEKVNRKEYLSEFIENVDTVFDEKTLNKLQALYGKSYTDALQNIIGRMKSGINRPNKAGKYERQWLNWVNNSVGTIMFFNRRSALLQMLSFTNFVNWSDNNPIKAAAAFANQPAYWKAWSKIFNSDKLKERRGGLKSDIQEQEIANQARTSRNKAGAITAYLLKIGFTPTQIADSMAIATGGATFLINRTKTYVKQGLSQADAEAKAFEDFSKVSDETQQSGDPMLISAQQSSHLGRLILAFQNTPMQYTRLMKKAGQDLINRRGDWKTNVSKIAYYGFIQNLIFNGLQQALFAFIPGFDDEDEEGMTEEQLEKLGKKENKKIVNTANGMIDSILRGSGLPGAVVSTLKNTIRRFYQERDKGFTGDQAQTLIELANVSPPIGSKLRKVYNSILTDQYDRDIIAKRGFEVTRAGRLNLSPSYQIVGNLSSALLNLPLDRVLIETTAISEMLDDRNTSWQRIALGLGWRTWDVNAKNEEEDRLKTLIKAKKAEASKRKAAIKRAKKKEEELKKLAEMTPLQKAKYLADEKAKRSAAAKKAAATRARNKRIKDSILYNN